ncbi:hypothetical protein DEA06_14420 [Microbacterium sp. Gd 4-13]|nr:hypothetical protein DEA06_14420 [Microbacterium sp. Gd 4-13]
MGEALSMGVRDGCESGTNSEPWGPRDYFYWRCNRTTSWVVRSDLGDPGEIIAAYRAHLAAIGCEPDPASFDMAAQYWALYGPTRQNANGEPYTVDDLPGAGANCTEDMQIGIGFRSSVGFDVAQYEHSYTSDGEEIEARNLDQTVIRSSGTEYIVTLSASTSYHQVLRSDPQPSDESTPEPLPCACYSGSSCDCPGG